MCLFFSEISLIRNLRIFFPLSKEFSSYEDPFLVLDEIGYDFDFSKNVFVE